MLETSAIILTTLWVLGMVSNQHLGGWIHLFMIAAIALMLISILDDRKWK